MLSIVIPVYNFDCSPLVTSLVEQFKNTKIEYEIICIDDASTKSFKKNKELATTSTISHIELPNNIGRSSIRNRLASMAKYDWLLFLDVDTFPVTSSYITNYINLIKQTKMSVIFGGLAYREVDIIENNRLRYIYGMKRESKLANERNKTSYQSLLFSNTLIKKAIFNKIQFNSNITKYGHEDSLFSQDLKRQKIEILHIDNPVFHTGLENDKAFINKTKIAIENLWNLYNKGLIKPNENKLLSYFMKMKSLHVSIIFSKIYGLFAAQIEKKILSKNPSIFLFDLFKLSYLCYISSNHMEKKPN